MTNSYGDLRSDLSIDSLILGKRLSWDKCQKTLEHILQNFNCFIAGGFALHCYRVDIPYGDIDFFFSSEEEKEKALVYIKGVMGFDTGNEEPYMGNTIRAHTFNVHGTVFQFIKAVHGDVKSVLQTFDFENAKIALVWNPAEKAYTFVYSPFLPQLVAHKKIMFRRQSHIPLNTTEDKQTFAKQNFSRLEKYLERFSEGFWDEESREHIFQQYAFNLKYKKKNVWARTLEGTYLRKLLLDKNTTLEELILFYPLGGEYKKLFENSSRGEAWVEPSIRVRFL